MSPAGKRIIEKLSDEALADATGKGWADWFALLDAWGATGRGHTEIARHLVEAESVSGWHAQSITVGYEQERGMREVGQSSAGDWQLSASRTVNAPAARCTAAFADEELRRRWLPEGELEVRAHRPGKSLTADWDGGASRIAVYLTPKDAGRTQVGLGHTRLPDADAVAAYKEFWRERLAALKALLESGESPG
ncbi:hypothetical protein ACF05T_24255 [Streptomyces lateritius]|uniref:DUF4287 domain-containing protein n=1 Tax=Streptomyces lateritius TaxID=67313 RepID=A0ABW6YH68_9ACTN